MVQSRDQTGMATGASAGTIPALAFRLSVLDYQQLADGSAMILLGAAERERWKNETDQVYVTAPFWLRCQNAEQYGLHIGQTIQAQAVEALAGKGTNSS